MNELKLSRRAVFAGTALCGLAGTIAACSANETPTAAPSAPTTATPSPEASRVLIAASEVPVGGGLVVPGPVLVVQPAPGTFKAFDPKCPHMGAVVAAPDATGTIVCPAHKARFQASDGARLSGAAQQGLTPIEIEVVDGQVRRARA